MKGKKLSLLLCLIMGALSIVGCGSTAADSSTQETSAIEDGATPASGGVKIGVTVQSLSNQVWAGACTEMESRAKADGNELTYMSCDDNSAKQIEQIENYIVNML